MHPRSIGERCSPDSEVEPIDVRIAQVAARQRGLITARQLRACGLDTAQIARRVRRGLLHKVFRGVYAVGAPPSDVLTWRMAGTLALPSNSALSGLACIDHAGFSRFTTRALEYETPSHSTIAIPGASITRTRAHHENQVRVLDGIATTSIAWTISRLGTVLTEEQLCHVIHQATWRRRATIDEIRAMADLNRSVAGHRTVARAISMFLDGSAGTRSRLEDSFLRMVRSVSTRPVQVGIHVPARGRSIEVDVFVPGLRLCCEVDGPPHDNPTQREEDLARDADLVAASKRVERFHWTEIQEQPEVTIHRLRALLR